MVIIGSFILSIYLPDRYFGLVHKEEISLPFIIVVYLLLKRLSYPGKGRISMYIFYGINLLNMNVILPYFTEGKMIDLTTEMAFPLLMYTLLFFFSFYLIPESFFQRFFVKNRNIQFILLHMWYSCFAVELVDYFEMIHETFKGSQLAILLALLYMM